MSEFDNIVVGGTGTINAMIYVRGQREDFNNWRRWGNTGRGYDDVLPYFKKSEDNERGENGCHAVDGPIARAGDIGCQAFAGLAQCSDIRRGRRAA